MTIQRKRSIQSGRGLLFGYFRNERGNVAAIMALMLVPLIGALSMAIEASNWYLVGRAAQNAADSAALAAANNAVPTIKISGGQPEYIEEGRANAASYGFTNGTNNASVSIANAQMCPDGSTTCYLATVSKVVPIYLTAVAGFRGDTTIGTVRAKTITSTALAETISAISFPSCVTAVGSDSTAPASAGTAISGSGTPSASTPQCSISAVGASPSSISCTGSNGLGAPFGFATGTISGSGGNTCVTSATTRSSFTFCDPYAATPASGCAAGTTAGYVSSAISAASGTPCATTHVGSGNNAVDQMTAITASCTYSTNNGAFQVSGNLNPSTPMVIVVSGNGATASFAASSSTSNITWIFTGSTANPAEFSGSSNINITAPNATSGSNLKGIAAYQAISASCTSSSCGSWSLNGSLTVQVSGLLYMPYTNGSFGGSVTETSTANCFISVFNSFHDNGTGLLLREDGCPAAGLASIPTVQRFRAALVK